MSSNSELQQMRDMYDQWAEEEAADLIKQDPLAKEYSYRTFISSSNGKRRKKRKINRQVQLIVKRSTGEAAAFKSYDGVPARIDDWAKDELGEQTHPDDDPGPRFTEKIMALAMLRLKS